MFAGLDLSFPFLKMTWIAETSTKVNRHARLSPRRGRRSCPKLSLGTREKLPHEKQLMGEGAGKTVSDSLE